MRTFIYLCIFFIIFSGGAFAQTNPGSNISEKDSIEILNQLMSMLDSSDKPSSNFFVNVGIGNRLYSVKNNAMNAYQSSSKIIYSPSVGYAHKSGLGVSVGANLLNEGSGVAVSQYAISPSFELMGNPNIDFGISYTHYFVKNKFSPYSSPIQNDFYTSFSYLKKWLQPGVAVGFSNGVYKDARHKDTVIAGIKRSFYDSVTYKLNAFSLMLTVGHQFFWGEVLDQSDGLALTPTLMVNAGSGRTAISHNTNAINLFKLLTKRGRISKLQEFDFALQSIGMNIDLRYMLGKFYLQPQLYLDYYLPASDPESKRFSQLFTFNVGCNF
jgi:hypothetical protein